VFIVDKQGKTAVAKFYEIGQVLDNDDAFEVLRKLSWTGRLRAGGRLAGKGRSIPVLGKISEAKR